MRYNTGEGAGKKEFEVVERMSFIATFTGGVHM